MGETFPMKGGDGADSYAKNSQFQKEASHSVKGMIEEAVMQNLGTEAISSSSTVTIVDLGCSVGPNTFLAVQNVIEAVQKKSSSKKLEFQVFFNDHWANDFNTLLASLPPDRQYHAAAAPGSFHERVFPRNSITVAYSSHALHWLSQLRVANEGRIHYAGSPDDVVSAYSDQFQIDVGNFLSARAEEVVRGGLMLLVLPATRDGVSPANYPTGFLFSYLGSTLMDLANQGVVDKAKIDAFNLPIYVPSVGEMREVIEKNGCFTIHKMELTIPRGKDEGPIDVAHLIMHLKAGIQGIFTSHFGDYVVEKMFANMSEKAQEMSDFIESSYRRSSATQLFLVLTRK